MSFQELIIFVEVVKQGGISAAANKLGLAKSAVSSKLSRLEERLNVKLLQRSSRRLSLTVAGKHILPRVESLIAEGERLFEQAELEFAQPSGSVKVALTPDFGNLVVTNFFPKVTQMYPQINMVSKFSYQFEDLQDPSFDLAIRIGKINDENLVGHKLGSFKRILVASPQYLKTTPIKHPNQLEYATCLLFSGDSTERVWKLFPVGKTEQPITVSVSTKMAVLSFSALVDLSRANQGIAYVPEFMVSEHLKSGELQRVLPEYQGQASSVFLAYRFGSEKIHRLKAVIDIAKQSIPDLLKAYRC